MTKNKTQVGWVGCRVWAGNNWGTTKVEKSEFGAKNRSKIRDSGGAR